jgi:hypothetical protein
MIRAATHRSRDLFDDEEPSMILSSSQKSQMLQLIQTMLMEVFAARTIEEAGCDKDNA